ncbi:MAG: hypothetical protein PHR81_00260 [Bacteroidales bacterium]|jgi:hypothetical protein|nr:hypothetical protein [Bacteroidales bacterium]MDD4213219.1 hypothetical protein [Bacteroidales bacterium]
MATKIPTKLKNKLEKLLCDADLDYLGREDYMEISNRLRREWDVFGIKNIMKQNGSAIKLNF